MKIINRILAILLLIAIICSFAGCARCVNVEYKNVEVTVIGKYYRGVYMTPIYNGKTTMFITHPAVYHIIVDYNGIEYTINDSDTYDKYKDKIGQTAIGQLRIKTYDDGAVKYDIVSLE